MNSRWFRLLGFFVLLVFSALLFADWQKSPGQVTIDILQPPTPLYADGKYFLVYELHLTNYHGAPTKLVSLEVSDGKNKIMFDEAKLAKLMQGIGVKKLQAPLLLQPGESRMILMWLEFPNKNAIPNQLFHQLTIDSERNKEKLHLKVNTPAMAIKKIDPLIVSAPLRGDYWLAGNAPSNSSGHRTANLVMNGHDYFAQRYAIDFIQIGKNGLSYQGDKSKNESYYAYGQDILAVSPGKVIEVVDNIPENIPNSGKNAVPMEIDTLGGNHVVLDLGNGYYAFYAHMIPGKIKVKEGEMVQRGQVLGQVGNSGNSSEPHLHFHIVNKPSFIAAEGVPYAFDHFFVRNSKVVSEDPVFKVEIIDESLTPKTNQLVLENAMIKF